MNLNEVKMVDLKRTEWDHELSDPLSGRYIWKGPKTYIVQDKATYGDANLRPPHILRWVCQDEDDPSMDNVESYKWDFQAEPVKMEDFDYYPEPMKPDVNHQYKFKDMLLMKIPLELWVAKMEKDQNRANNWATQERRAFETSTQAEGAELPEANISERGKSGY
jgi:hypothetical protein